MPQNMLRECEDDRAAELIAKAANGANTTPEEVIRAQADAMGLLAKCDIFLSKKSLMP